MKDNAASVFLRSYPSALELQIRLFGEFIMPQVTITYAFIWQFQMNSVILQQTKTNCL